MSIENGAKKLSSGLLNHYEPTLKILEKQLSELMTKQKLTLKEIETENTKFKNVNNSELNDMFLVVRDYQIRLMSLKKEMTLLSERSARIKKRALKLQEYKQKEALENAHYREAQLKREQDLIVHSCPGSSSNTS